MSQTEHNRIYEERHFRDSCTSTISHLLCNTLLKYPTVPHFQFTPRTMSPSISRCPFKWQCPVSSPIILLYWSLLKLSNSPGLLAEGLLQKPLTCLCPQIDCQYASCFSLVQPASLLLSFTKILYGQNSFKPAVATLPLVKAVIYIPSTLHSKPPLIMTGYY